jgi:hypothetical protein
VIVPIAATKRPIWHGEDMSIENWGAEGWEPLPLSDGDVEVVAHLHLKPGASQSERISDLWPQASEDEGLELLDAAVNRINAAASAATGNPGNVIHGPEQASPTDPVPLIRLRLMGKPCVEARTAPS